MRSSIPDLGKGQFSDDATGANKSRSCWRRRRLRGIIRKLFKRGTGGSVAERGRGEAVLDRISEVRRKTGILA